MTGLALNRRLLRPEQEIDFPGLAAMWHQETIEMTLEGMGLLVDCPSLLNKVRGALGSVLLEGASAPVRRRCPCTWSPPCAAEVFFGAKPQICIGAFSSEIPKPFVLVAEKNGAELCIHMHIFGLARQWIGEVAAALASALQLRVRWRDLAKDHQVFVPAVPQVTKRIFRKEEKIIIPQTPEAVHVQFQTPLDAERATPEERPHLLFDRLIRRISLLARWHGVDLTADLDALKTDWEACLYDFESQRAPLQGDIKIRGGHKFKNRLVSDWEMTIEGNLESLWPILVLGEHTNVGRGASIGLGKYRLLRPEGY